MLAAAALLAAHGAQAETYEQGFYASMSAEYDSNAAFSPRDPVGVWRFAAIPAYTFMTVSGVDRWNARANLRLERSTNESVSAPRQDPNLFVNWTRETPRGELGITVRYEEQSTRETELLDTGRVAADGTRATRALSGRWNRALSERSDLLFDGGYTGVTYTGTNLTDYANAFLGGTWSHERHASDVPYVRLATTHFEPTGRRPSSDGLDALIGLRRSTSQRLNWEIAVGGNRVWGENPRNGWIGDFSMSYERTPRTRFAFAVSRSVTPSGEGELTEAGRLSANWQYELSEYGRVGADVFWRDTRGTAPDTTSGVSVWANRELSPAWSLRLSYAFRQQEPQGGAKASGHTVALVLSCAHPMLSLF